MSAADRIARLETQARENNEQFEILSHTNWLLSNCNTQQQTELSGFEEEFQGLELDPEMPEITRGSRQARHDPSHRPPTDQLLPSPSPLPTPFYIAAREAPQLDLHFVIPGLKGETLELRVDRVDLAFVLQRTLERGDWTDITTAKGVEDFLQVPMVKVRWMDGKWEFGRLRCTE